MATVGIRERIYTDKPAVPVEASPFEVRTRLTGAELVGVVVVVAACALGIGYEFGYRRPAQDAAVAAKAAADAARTARARPAAQPLAATTSATAASRAPTSATVATDVQTAAAAVSAIDPVVRAQPPAANRATAQVADKTNVPAASASKTGAQRNELGRNAATIYRCRRNDGEVFWSQLNCAQHRGAALERSARVPGNMAFEGQVMVADAESKRIEAALRAEQAEMMRMNTCAALVGEGAQILRRSGDVSVLADVQSQDRARARQIEDQQRQLRCGG